MIHYEYCTLSSEEYYLPKRLMDFDEIGWQPYHTIYTPDSKRWTVLLRREKPVVGQNSSTLKDLDASLKSLGEMAGVTSGATY